MKKKFILICRWALVPPMLISFAAFALLSFLFDYGREELDED